MAKTALKKALFVDQDGIDVLTDKPLTTTNLKLLDTDRITQKKDNGQYTPRSNVRLTEPREHMTRHGILRDREPALDHLKMLFDDRVQMMKLMLKENNQLLAYERRTDSQNPETFAFLEAHLKPIEARIGVIDRELTKALKVYPDKLAQAALKVKGFGPITVSALTVYIDFMKMVCNQCHRSVRPEGIVDDKHETRYCACVGWITLCHAASTPSALWKYVGLHTASHERYVKGEAGGGNKTLRTVLYNTACVMMKMKDGAYRQVYDRTKLRLSQSEKIVKTRDTSGKLVERPWRETKPSHRHGAALRAVMKHILADYWLVGRTLAGLPTVPLYAESMLGHTHIISPRERGWEF